MVGIIRKVAETISRNKVFRRSLTVSGKKIPIYVSPDAQLKYLKLGANAFDTDLVQLAERFVKADSVVWDIGANVGTFTFSAASLIESGTVVAVEADTWLVGVLRMTSGLDDYRNKDIAIVPVAVSNRNAIASFMVAARGRASNALEMACGRSEMGGVREKQYVPTMTLDTLLESFPAPDFVKVDIEGAEYMALQGATKLINEVRPRFYIEVGQNVSPQVFNIFSSASYEGFDSGGVVLDGHCAPNTLFLPR